MQYPLSPVRAGKTDKVNMAQGAGKGIRTCTDLYGRWAQGYVGAVRSGNSKTHGLPRRSAAKTGAEGGPLAGKALCAERMVRAEYVGPVGLVGLVRRWALGCVRPGNSGISGAQGLPQCSTATYRPFLRDTRAAGFFPEAGFLPLADFFPFSFFSG